ncbi:MAG: hypothetical protein ACREEM_30095 [Blastocatellia bacterium]
MALIENLDKRDWREFLGNLFGYTLDVMKNDRFRLGGSALDDLRAWLVSGGVSRVKAHLAEQLKDRRYSTEKQADILAFVDQLAAQHRPKLLELATQDIIGGHLRGWMVANGLPDDALYDLAGRFQRQQEQEKPKETNSQDGTSNVSVVKILL